MGTLKRCLACHRSDSPEKQGGGPGEVTYLVYSLLLNCANFAEYLWTLVLVLPVLLPMTIVFPSYPIFL